MPYKDVARQRKMVRLNRLRNREEYDPSLWDVREEDMPFSLPQKAIIPFLGEYRVYISLSPRLEPYFPGTNVRVEPYGL